MSFEERSYRMLVVSASEKFNTSLHKLLQQSRFEPIRFAGSVASAKRELLENSYDMVLINAPLPDDFGTRLAIDVSTESSAICMVLVKTELHEAIYSKVAGQGVFTLAKPAPAQTLLSCFNWMISARERLRKVEKKATSIESRMEEIRLVNKAKWILIDQQHMSEDAAHRFISKQAMDQCTTKAVIADLVIRQQLVPQ